MKYILILALTVIFSSIVHSQLATFTNGYSIYYGKEFSKDVALYNAKNFLFKNVFGSTPEVVRFEVIPLAAASSGELTTLLYRCDSKQKEGLVLGFYGNYWNDAGVFYQGYAYNNLPKEKAFEFLHKIQDEIQVNKDFLLENPDKNNIYFKYDDIDILIWSSQTGNYTIRLFWGKFDSIWESTAYERTKKRFEKNIK